MPNATSDGALDSPTVTDEEVTLPRFGDTGQEPSTGVRRKSPFDVPKIVSWHGKGRLVKLLLVDLSHVFWSTWHATAGQPVDTADSPHPKDRHLKSGFDRVAICCDIGHRGQERVSAYKANRPERDRCLRSTQAHSRATRERGVARSSSRELRGG